MKLLQPRPLTREAFAPFGQVIELEGATQFAINGGTTQRFHDLARVDTLAEGGRPLISLFRAQPRAQPVRLTLMERHPLGSQAFLPLSAQPYLVVVAPDHGGRPGPLQAFVTCGWQGVNYDRNVWHHPLLALEAVCDFIVVDRGGEGCNLEEWPLAEPTGIF
ncbi:ureidoglycolate lyase [Variovorax terrae]|uniref:Ureidoglycolate lyase n=1 Tax=Variovorax terrae TaxID=2923278 RepID=A0A9X1VXM2_9BURK|nr:ureidoglycolate lyase [Variovorax terrae]MCJ0763862.1 ureidoglycolate lyase [Variovorax terrae]